MNFQLKDRKTQLNSITMNWHNRLVFIYLKMKDETQINVKI